MDSVPKKDRASQVKTVAYLLDNYKNQLRFQGKVLNKTMFSAAQAVCQAFPDAGHGQKMLNLLFLWRGPVLSSYARLYKIVTTVAGFVKEAAQPNLQEEMLAGIMAFGLYDLKTEDIYASELTSDDMLFGESNVPGYLQMAFLRVCCLHFLQAVADKAKASQKCLDMMQNMTPGSLEKVIVCLVKQYIHTSIPDR